MKNTKTTSIRATSRASVKIRDSYYTFEYSEERQINLPDEISEEDLAKERFELWQECNSQVDAQIEEITDFLKK